MPRRRFGQHFLTDKPAVANILQLVQAKTSDHIVEIGPGRGALTQDLLSQTPDGLIEAIEIDPVLVQYLRKHLGSMANFRLHHADILDFDLSRLETKKTPLRIVGNLPYNISTPLLMRLLTATTPIGDMHFMLQLEVVERIVAPVGSTHYSGLSVLIACHAKCAKLFEIDAQAFSPPPKVRSAFIRVMPHPSLIEAQLWPQFKLLVQSIFSNRRKKLRHSVGSHVSPSQLEAISIDPNARPQTLGVEAYIRIMELILKPT